MGQFVIVTFKPKAGMEEDLREVVLNHVPTLQSIGLATSRPAYIMKSKNGTIVEVFEWVSAEAIAKAHEHPVVLEMWKKFEAVCEYKPLNEIDECKEMFPGFEPLN
jgi:hypothetical protein